MYYVRKIKKTKKNLSKASYIISLPMNLQKKVESHNSEISKRLAYFSRIRYLEIPKSRCLLLAVWSDEQPPNWTQDRERTTTIQKSGRTSRYVIIPKDACKRFCWHTGTELVIGFDYGISQDLHDVIYEDIMFPKPEGIRPEALLIRFQKYRDMKEIYGENLAERKAFLEKHKDEIFWETRHDYVAFERAMARLKEWKKKMRKEVWDSLYMSGLVCMPYVDYLKLRAEQEREKKKRNRLLRLQKKGHLATWDYRKKLVKVYGTDWDAKREAMLDDPEYLNELRAEDPERYRMYFPEREPLYGDEEPNSDQAF